MHRTEASNAHFRYLDLLVYMACGWSEWIRFCLSAFGCRSRSGVHADAQDEEAAAADEAFDFPRFVIPLFREEARQCY